MTGEDARREIVPAWDRWIERQPNVDSPFRRDAFKFFFELQAKRSPLLDFPDGSIDRWLVVHGWLLAAGRVRD
jgi:hypothetical protein